ncbi:MAG: hypothetical protein ACOH1Y_02070 [Propionicimonas sp.]
MKPMLAVVAALTLAFSLNLGVPAPFARADSGAVVVQQQVLPAAPQKTSKPKPVKTQSPTATPAAATPTAKPRSAAEEEGDRWVQIAMVAGGGLLGCVIVFFGIGALLRRRPRPRT